VPEELRKRAHPPSAEVQSTQDTRAQLQERVAGERAVEKQEPAQGPGEPAAEQVPELAELEPLEPEPEARAVGGEAAREHE
jgi:hypothetical protein